MKNCFISVTYFDLHSLQFTTSSKELHVSVHSIKECDYKRVLTRGGSPPHRPVYRFKRKMYLLVLSAPPAATRRLTLEP